MENVREIAQAVKDHLISLIGSTGDNLPLDMNELNVSDIEDIIAKTMNIITVVKPQPRKICYWSGVDVKMKVDELNDSSSEYKIDCTDGFINAVLDVVEDRFDANYGTTWEDVEEAIIYVVEQDRI